MRIHSDIITQADLTNALKAACAQRGGSIYFGTLTEHRSMKRGKAYEVKLEAADKIKGDKRRRPNTGDRGAGYAWAATRDEWGEFLAYLYDRVDPDMIAGHMYSSASGFHGATRYAYGD